MRFFAFLFFLIEAVFIYLFVDKFGFLNYFLEVLVSGFVGIALQLGLSFGGALLFLPGILTDVFGIAVVVFSLVFKKNVAKNESYQEFKFQNFSEQGSKKDDGEIIDVEVIEEPKRVN